MPTYPTRHPHAQLSLTILHNPKISGYAQLHGEFNYNATPLAPSGTQVTIHEKPTVRGTWAPHGVKGWYMGPSMNHYRCRHVYFTKTRGERDSEFVDFYLHNTPLPYKSSAEMPSFRRKNWPMPCITQHLKRHFQTSANPS